MICRALLIFLLIACSVSVSRAESQWTTDLSSAKHFAVGAGIGAISDTALYHVSNPGGRGERMIFATSLAGFAGLYKEVKDPVFDYGDLTYTILGGVAGAFCSEFFNGYLVVSPNSVTFVAPY